MKLTRATQANAVIAAAAMTAIAMVNESMDRPCCWGDCPR